MVVPGATPMSQARRGGTLSRAMRTIGTARQQLWLFFGAYVLYTVGRFAAASDVGPATENAHEIIRLEHDLGIAVEQSVQNALNGGVVMWLFSYVYLAAQFVVLPAALLWLYRRAPDIYRRLRNTVIATWAIAVPIHALLPVAPPRLADIGMIDSVSQQAAVSLAGRSTMFYNEFAAVPSLHCGFACAVGIALALAVSRRSLKLLALLWGPVVCLTVVVTGNHYVVDIVVGIAVALAGYFVGQLPEKLAVHRRLAGASRGGLAAQPA